MPLKPVAILAWLVLYGLLALLPMGAGRHRRDGRVAVRRLNHSAGRRRVSAVSTATLAQAIMPGTRLGRLHKNPRRT
jgi:hypothetical protein